MAGFFIDIVVFVTQIALCIMRNALCVIKYFTMNPFILSGFQGKQYFCNRETELKKLEEAIINGRNVTLTSLRRMGKSSLIKYLFQKIVKKRDCIIVDIYSASDFNGMTQLLANAVTEYYGRTVKDYLNLLKDLIKSLGATITFNDLTGSPELSFGFNAIHQSDKGFKDIIQFLDSRSKKVVLVFDEFQQVVSFPEKNTEATLRTIIQNTKNINYIFMGSNKGIMESMFRESSRPFYQSTELMYLNEIEKKEYSNFINEKFIKGGQNISKEQISFIYDLCRGHTYYIQYICNRLYSKNFQGQQNILIDTIQGILEENEPVYYNYKNLLTEVQWRLLMAIAKEESIEKPLSSKYLKTYNLTSTSSIQRALKSLTDDEMIIHYKEKYYVYDVFFSVWLKEYSI